MPKGKKKGKSKHGFADSDEEEEAPAAKDEQQIEEEATAAAKKEKKKAKKAKKAKGAQDESAEAATSLAQDEPTDGAVEGEPADEGGADDDQGESLIVAEVYEVKPHPKLAATQQLVTLFDGQDMYKVVTEYPLQEEDLIVYAGWVQLQDVEAEQAAEELAAEAKAAADDAMDEDEAAASTSTAAQKGSKGGNNTSSAFAALIDEDEGMEEDLQPDEPKAAAGKNGKSGKKGKSKKETAASFAALMGSDDDDGSVAEEEAPKQKSGKGKKKGASAFAELMDDDEAEADDEPAPPPASSKSKKKQKKKDKAAKSAFSDLLSDDDAEDSSMAPEPAETEVNLVTTPVDSLASIEQVTAALAAAGISKTRKQSLKQRLKKLEEDAVMAELESVPLPKGLGKKGKDAKAADDTPQEVPVQDMTFIDDVQAAMDAPGVSKTRKQKLKQRLKQLQDEAAAAAGVSAGGSRQEQSVTELPVDALTTVEQVQAAMDDPGVSKTRKQKLKQRLKALQDTGKVKEDAPVEVESKGGKGGKKPSAAVRAMQQQVEERKRADEEARAAAEAKRIADEEAALQEELELQREEEERVRKAEEKKAQREQLRKDGKLLTTKQKAEARKLAAERELRLAKARDAGLSIDGPADKLTAAQQEDKRKQTKKRQKELAEQRAKEQAAAELASLEQKRAAEKAEREQKKKEEAAKASKGTEAADDWEDEVPDDWDADDESVDQKGEQGGESEEDDDSEEESSEEESSEEDSSDDDDSSEYSTDSEEEREQRLAEARAKREARFSQAMEKRNKDDLRSPICCILGHVDTGKTKILDNIRRTNVQGGEAGGITQQIGATYIPASAVETRTVELRKDKAFDMKMPGLLVIDTPGHESFSNLRSRGSSLCDIAVLVVDVMHGLEQQTIESINLLKSKKSPFVIALNKIDRMYNWKVMENGPVRDSLEQQEQATKDEFERRVSDSMLALNEQGLNVELYWRNKDPRRFVNIVPTSAITGEGICDLMWLIVKLTQSMMMDRLMFVEELQCTVLEVKVVEGYGYTIDAVLVNGRVKEGDKVVICGLQGPIVTHIRSLLTPHPLKELRVKNTYIHHKEIKAAQGIKMSAPNLEYAVAGTQLYVVGKDDDEEELKELVMEDMSDIFDKKEPEGVCVQASTLGSLEALLEFLSSDAVQIPVSGINIGPVHKKDIMRANIMAEKKLKKYSCLLAFDVPINREATALAQSLGVTVFSADIIYHLFDMFMDYTKKCKADEKADAQMDAVFPCRMRIVPNCVFNAKDPIVLGCEILEGQLRLGTPITIPGKDCDLGRVAGMEKDHKAVEIAERGDSVAVKIEASNSTEGSRLFGRHFLETDELYSKITRESINALKAHFRDEMTQPLWQLIIKLKKVFKID